MPDRDNGSNPLKRIRDVQAGYPLKFSKKSIKRFKDVIGFDSNQPACFNCKFFRQEQLIMTNSTYKKKPGTCKLFYFSCQSTSICDYWESTEGEKLNNYTLLINAGENNDTNNN